MLQWLRIRRMRRNRILLDARYLLGLHGAHAVAVACARADSASARERRYWLCVLRRIERSVAAAEPRPAAPRDEDGPQWLAGRGAVRSPTGGRGLFKLNSRNNPDNGPIVSLTCCNDQE